MNDIKRGEMFYISRGGASYNGSEQHSDRPAVVVSNNKNNENSNVVEIVYMTTQSKTDLPTHVTVRSTGRISTVLCEQVYSVSTERVREGQAEIPGMVVKAFMDGKETIEGLKDRITGRYSCEDIYDKDGNMIVKHNHMITPSRAAKILSVGVNAQGEPIEEVKIRTILTCRSHVGICAKCYGANMATGEAVQVRTTQRVKINITQKGKTIVSN